MKRSTVPILVRQLTAEAPDAELLKRYVLHRTDDAFTLLVSRYARLVWGQCRNLLANEADAEDAFQATFVILARSAKSLRSDSPLGPWLHGVAFRVCQNARRAAARRERHERANSRPEVNRPVADSAWEIAFAAVSAEVQKLPEAQRAVFVLCGLEGRSEGEAAVALGQKVGTISSRLARAKQVLLDRLSKRGFGTGAAVLGGIAASSTDAPAAVTARALVLLLSGGAVPGSIQSLTRGVTGMAFVRFKLLATGVLFAAGLTFGAASGWFGSAAAQPAPDQKPPARDQAKDKPEKEEVDPQKAALVAKLKTLAYPNARPESDSVTPWLGQTIHFTTDDLKKVEAWYREKLHIAEGLGNGVAYLPWPAGETALARERRSISIAQDEIRPNREKKDLKVVREPTVRNFVVRTPEGTVTVLLNRIPGDKETMIVVTFLPPTVTGSRDAAPGTPEDLRAGAGEVLVIEVTESKTTLPPVGAPTTVTMTAVVKHVEKSARKLKAGDTITVEYEIPGAGAGAARPKPPVMLKQGDVRVAYLNFNVKRKAYSIAAGGQSFSGVIEPPSAASVQEGPKPNKFKDPLKVGGQLPFVVVTFHTGSEVGEGSPGVMIGNAGTRGLVIWSRAADEAGMALAQRLERLTIADDQAERYFVVFDGDAEAVESSLGKADLKKVAAGRSRKPSAEMFERAGLDEKVSYVVTLLDGKEVKAVWTLTAAEATAKRRNEVMREAEMAMGRLDAPRGDSAPSGHMNGYSEFEDAVFLEVMRVGLTTAPSVVTGLDTRGVKCKVADVQTAMDRWVARGWMQLIDGKTRLSQHAVAYMR